MYFFNAARTLVASSVVFTVAAASPVALPPATAQNVEKRDYMITPKVFIIDMVCDVV